MRLVIVLLALCTLCLVQGSFVHDWRWVRSADSSERLTFHVALRQHNVKELEKLLMSVSDPDSPLYGKHASKEQISKLVSPSKGVVNEVKHWILENADQEDNVEIAEYDDALKVTASLSSIVSLFGGEYHWYTHGPTGHSVIRAEAINIPSKLRKHVEFVTGLVSFPIITKHTKKMSAPLAEVEAEAPGKWGFFAPSTIRRLYNIPAGTQATNKNSSQCAIEFTPEGAFSPKDLQIYQQLSNETIHNFTRIIGPFKHGEDNGESELDVQLLSTIGSGAENWFWTIHKGWIYEMAVQIYNASAKPFVFSISYGWPEIHTCGSTITRANCSAGDNADYIARANTEIMKLGAMGCTFLVSSGDDGAPSNFNPSCTNKTHPVFGLYPTSSPYVTSVSGTAAGPENTTSLLSASDPPICNKHGCDTSNEETPCMWNNTAYQWNTGGGFSELITRPAYQDTVVKAYIAKAKIIPPAEYYWPNNRGYPDISAVGARILIVSGGQVSVEEGTSASAPIIAGIVSLLNDYRFNNKKAPLGFLNPLLYKMAQSQPNAFKDITTGHNKCTEGRTCCEYGYGAEVGWDAVTGLGTPNYLNMLAFIKNLP